MAQEKFEISGSGGGGSEEDYTDLNINEYLDEKDYSGENPIPQADGVDTDYNEDGNQQAPDATDQKIITTESGFSYNEGAFDTPNHPVITGTGIVGDNISEGAIPESTGTVGVDKASEGYTEFKGDAYATPTYDHGDGATSTSGGGSGSGSSGGSGGGSSGGSGGGLSNRQKAIIGAVLLGGAAVGGASL